MTTLSRKMLGYALGRTVAGVRSAADRARWRAAGGDASFSDLAVKIVTSRQFRNRAGDDDASPADAERRSAPTFAADTGSPMSIMTTTTSVSRHGVTSCAAWASRWRCPGWSRCRCFGQSRGRGARPNTPPLRLGHRLLLERRRADSLVGQGQRRRRWSSGPALLPMMPHREDMVFIQGLYNQTARRLDQPAPRPHEPAVGRAGQPRSRTRSASARRWTRSSPSQIGGRTRSRAWCSASSRTSCGSKTACR